MTLACMVFMMIGGVPMIAIPIAMVCDTAIIITALLTGALTFGP